jgi:tRNA dimethylallyltransferase
MAQVLAIVGPTASGKTKLSILLAERLHGEIISADSRQIYRYLDIGTAKPTPEQLQHVIHHFVDILDPDQDYSAAEYGQQARLKIEEVLKYEKLPVIAGGSGLYIRAIIDGIFQGTGKNVEIREQLEEEVRSLGKEALFEKLKKIDPVSASKMDATKIRRVIRALEVYYTTGKLISDLQGVQQTKPAFGVVQFGIDWERKALYERIHQRVDNMIENGLVEEVHGLIAKGYHRNINALNSVGYKETFDFIEGKLAREKMIDLIKQNTRRFAKRQMTWFRADKRIHWIHVDKMTDWNEIADFVQKEFLSARKYVASSEKP